MFQVLETWQCSVSIQETPGPTNRLLWPCASKRHGLPCGCAPGDIGNTVPGWEIHPCEVATNSPWNETFDGYIHKICMINHIYLEPVCSLFWGFNPPKGGLFQSKQGSFGFQVYNFYIRHRNQSLINKSPEGVWKTWEYKLGSSVYQSPLNWAKRWVVKRIGLQKANNLTKKKTAPLLNQVVLKFPCKISHIFWQWMFNPFCWCFSMWFLPRNLRVRTVNSDMAVDRKQS